MKSCQCQELNKQQNDDRVKHHQLKCFVKLGHKVALSQGQARSQGSALSCQVTRERPVVRRGAAFPLLDGPILIF
jgi:hypothetical protein